MRGLGGSTLRGGQTVFHGLRMWGQLVQAAMMLAAFMVVAVPAWNLWRSTTGAEWYAAGMYTLAEVKLVLGYEPESGQEIRFGEPSGGFEHVSSVRGAASLDLLRASGKDVLGEPLHGRDGVFGDITAGKLDGEGCGDDAVCSW